MRNLRSLTGMPVVCGNRRLGRALRGELTGDLRQLEGIWFGGGLRGTRYVPAEKVQLLGSVAIMVDDTGERRRMPAKPTLLRAVSTDGRLLGAITGAWIDEVSFTVSGVELSTGLWDDLLHGRRVVDRYTVRPESGEVIIDPNDASEEVEVHEERTDEGTDRGNADRRLGGDGLWRHELADGAKVEPEGQTDGQLDR